MKEYQLDLADHVPFWTEDRTQADYEHRVLLFAIAERLGRITELLEHSGSMIPSVYVTCGSCGTKVQPGMIASHVCGTGIRNSPTMESRT